MSSLKRNEVASGSDPLALLERARLLAQGIREGCAAQSSEVAGVSRVGEKREKGEKPLHSATVESPSSSTIPDLTQQDPEVAWRLEAMLKQVPETGPVRDLIARQAPIQLGTCFSCGDPLKGNQRYRCR